MDGWGAAFFLFLKDWQIGDLTGILGAVGLIFTFLQARKARTAAEAARMAAEGTKSQILALETIVEFSDVIALLEDISRLHRNPNVDLLLERYTLVRKKIVALRTGRMQMNDSHDTRLQSALTTITQIQDVVERNGDDTNKFDAPKWNRLISRDIDALSEAFNGIKRDHAGV